MRDSPIPLRPARDQPSTVMPTTATLLAPAIGLGPLPAETRVALGMAQVDDWLLGGLRRNALHEAYAAGREDTAAAMALALLMAWRNNARDCLSPARAIIWVRELAGPSLPYGPGLVDLGIDPRIVTLLLLPDDRAVLRAALDSVRQGAAGSVLIELRGRQPLLDLTATRRFALAAQESGTMVWLIRGEAQPAPSAAQTRWQVGHAPAALGNRPAFDLTLLRHRGGREGLHVRMEWDRDTASFQPSPIAAADPLSGVVSAVVAGRTDRTTDTGRGERAA